MLNYAYMILRYLSSFYKVTVVVFPHVRLFITSLWYEILERFDLAYFGIVHVEPNKQTQ